MSSDGSPYEKRIDAKGRVLSDECIADEAPFEELPEGWAWARLATICQVKGGKRIPAGRKLSIEQTPQKYIRVSDMQNATVLQKDVRYVPTDLIEKLSRYTISCNDIYITVAGSIGRVGLIPESFNGANLTENADKLVFFLPLNKQWLCGLLTSPMIQLLIKEATTQVGQPKLAIKRIETFLLPIPPLAEQRRIAERVEELMPLVEEYGRLEDAREALDAALPGRLRKSVLQMAVQGKLVPQDPSDEPAGVLLERIREQRRELVAEKKMKAPKGGESVIFRGSDGRRYEKRIDAKGHESEPACVEDEIPFDIPDSWEWVRLESLIVLLSGTDLKPTQYNDKNEGIPYLTGASNFVNGELVENRWTTEPTRISTKGELLFTCKGTVGEMAINRFDAAHIARQIMAITPCEYEMLPYITLLLKAMVEDIKSHAKGVIPGIERNTLLARLIPVPPLAEQNRIAEKSAELFSEIA